MTRRTQAGRTWQCFPQDSREKLGVQDASAGVTAVAAEEGTARTQRCMGIGRGGAAKRKIQKDPAQPCMETTREDEPTPGDLPGDLGILGGFPPGMARCVTCMAQ